MTPGELAAKLRALGQGGVSRIVQKTLVAVALIGEGEAKGRAPVRSGHLARSITGTVRQGAGGPEAVLSAGGRVEGAAPVVYAGSIEYGFKGMERPKNSKFFRVPLPAALTGAGLDRYPSPLRISGAGVFYVQRTKSPDRLVLIHRPSGQPWYILVRRLKPRPAQPFLRPAARVAAERMPRQFAKHFTAELQGQR